MSTLTYGALPVHVEPTNRAMGQVAAQQFADLVDTYVQERGDIAVILATGNSQLTFLDALTSMPDVPWSRITVLHMDEYLGMAEDHPASFRRYMSEKLLARVSPKAFHGMRGDAASPEEEIERYTALLRDLEPVICVMGIGENGHLAFNDPPADFETDALVHVVTLDDACRAQQVGEGYFAGVDDVPAQAITLTVPALVQPSSVLVLAPEARKATAVARALEGPVTPDCPASLITTLTNTVLYLDEDSAAELSSRAAEPAR
jgi:glucosamine-6-phosphate deaminase